jgi:hypothetical protein
MCDYSLHHVTSRPAKVGDRLVATSFPATITRGFAGAGEPGVAVCLLPGTEIAFDDDVRYYDSTTHMPARCDGQRTARFRQVNKAMPNVHHDALEFPDGRIVLLTQLCEGQHATVLQLPATARAPEGAREKAEIQDLVLIR